MDDGGYQIAIVYSIGDITMTWVTVSLLKYNIYNRLQIISFAAVQAFGEIFLHRNMKPKECT